jgi:hypothetical protein
LAGWNKFWAELVVDSSWARQQQEGQQGQVESGGLASDQGILNYVFVLFCYKINYSLINLYAYVLN